MRKKSVLSMILIGIMVAVFSGFAGAQPPQMPSPEEMAKNETAQMKTACSLTADQLPNVEAVNLKYARKMGEMFGQGPGGDFAEMQKKMTEMETQKRNDLSKILSVDQLKKYDKMIEEQRKNMPGPPM